MIFFLRRVYEKVMKGSHDDCVYCTRMNYTDPLYHGELDRIQKIGLEQYASSKNREVVYQDIHAMYMEKIYEPLRQQELLSIERGVEVENPVVKWTIESIAHHFEKDEINPIKKILKKYT